MKNKKHKPGLSIKKRKLKIRNSFSPKQSYELLRIRISQLEKDVFELKVKNGLAKAELEPIMYQDSTGDGV